MDDTWHGGHSMYRWYLHLVVALGLFSLPMLDQPASAAVDFSFTFTDASGVGFNHALLGADRRAALDEAASIVEALFVNYDATIEIDVSGSETGPSTLASAGSNYSSGFPGTGFVDQGDVMKKILGGDAMDPNPNLADGTVDWNFSNFWELENSFQLAEYDFIATAAHELMHTVGFVSAISQSGEDTWDTPLDEPGTWEPFDRFVEGPSGPVINSSTFVLNSSVWNSASTGGTNGGLFFTGPEAMQRNGGNPVSLYSPSPWDDGSSGSHLNDDLYNGTYMMEAVTDEGLGVRTISNLERAILQDIGYSLIAYQTSLFADLDSDGTVNSTDLGLLLNNFRNMNSLGYTSGNLNGDANVDSADLGLLLNVFGSTIATSAVPEPDGRWLLVLSFPGLVGRRRK